MYTQFFGNFLLANNYVTKEQLFSAMQKQKDSQLKPGFVALYEGLITAYDIEQIRELMHQENKTFGTIATEQGYLTNEQVLDLLNHPAPDFLLLGQLLVHDGVLSSFDLENIIADYRSQNEIYELDMDEGYQENLENLFGKFFISSETPISIQGQMYFKLMYSDLLHHIGDDFTLLSPSEMTEFPISLCVSQKIIGDYSVTSYLNMDKTTAIEFASRYVGEEFYEFDEYVQASLDDFLNLHNGVFISNCSNAFSIELTLTPPEHHEDGMLSFENTTYYFPVLCSFGTVDFLLEIEKLV